MSSNERDMYQSMHVGSETNNNEQREDGRHAAENLASQHNLETNYTEMVNSFEKMGLREELLRGVFAYGFEKPSVIQQLAIVPCCQRRDVIAQAQSGTGKTATFAIGLLQQINTDFNDCQALVMAPTRELAQQIQKVILALGDHMGVKVLTCIGGTSVATNREKLGQGCHVAVGTPGRVLDMIRGHHLQTKGIKTFVWMKQTKCSLVVLSNKYTRFLSLCLLMFRLFCCLPLCQTRCFK
ncbi:Eukaryotic initiation factor 4A-II [Trichinella spiralis]|uniref:ATP-dependent RNA helicase n=1 Tax=Trichinella spiralis TaxID=6334 RepID=A0ABR3KMP7_TRISP